ncbi:MAG: hypothetical protein QOK14_829 [Frankiaceae bacterium]|nr:hypothetical protein [Frankiaceae bacterium]
MPTEPAAGSSTTNSPPRTADTYEPTSWMTIAMWVIITAAVAAVAWFLLPRL